MWIENVSLEHIKQGIHYDAGVNSMLIQIVDPGTEFPTPKYEFKTVRQYRFLDVENEGMFTCEHAITDIDAANIAADLLHARDNSMNVIVHCHAGLCRSGAVAEVGVILGFQDTEKLRIPNLMVKSKLLEQLGMI